MWSISTPAARCRDKLLADSNQGHRASHRDARLAHSLVGWDVLAISLRRQHLFDRIIGAVPNAWLRRACVFVVGHGIAHLQQDRAQVLTTHQEILNRGRPSRARRTLRARSCLLRTKPRQRRPGEGAGPKTICLAPAIWMTTGPSAMISARFFGRCCADAPWVPFF